MSEEVLDRLVDRLEHGGGFATSESYALIEEVRRLRLLIRESTIAAGPYIVTQWTEDVRHADPCDCDLDEELVGDACMANSEWTYAVTVDGGAFAPRLILTLPKRPPEQPDHDGPPLVATEPDHCTCFPYHLIGCPQYAESWRRRGQSDAQQDPPP